MRNDFATIAIVSSSHGLKGEARIFPIIKPPQLLTKIECLYYQNAEGEFSKLHLSKVRPYKKGLWLLSVAEWTSIDDVLELKGKELLVPKQKLPKLPDNTFYIGDLIGCHVYEEDILVGKIINVMETGSNDIYIIETNNKRQLMLPAVKEFVHKVDIDNKIIMVSIPDGLYDL